MKREKKSEREGEDEREGKCEERERRKRGRV